MTHKRRFFCINIFVVIFTFLCSCSTKTSSQPTSNQEPIKEISLSMIEESFGKSSSEILTDYEIKKAMKATEDDILYITTASQFSVNSIPFYLTFAFEEDLGLSQIEMVPVGQDSYSAILDTVVAEYGRYTAQNSIEKQWYIYPIQDLYLIKHIQEDNHSMKKGPNSISNYTTTSQSDVLIRISLLENKEREGTILIDGRNQAISKQLYNKEEIK